MLLDSDEPTLFDTNCNAPFVNHGQVYCADTGLHVRLDCFGHLADLTKNNLCVLIMFNREENRFQRC